MDGYEGKNAFHAVFSESTSDTQHILRNSWGTYKEYFRIDKETMTGIVSCF